MAHRVEVRLEVADVRVAPARGAARVRRGTPPPRQRPGVVHRLGRHAGCPPGAIGNADSTTIDVSLRRNTSSMKWSTEKQTRRIGLAALLLREAGPEVPALLRAGLDRVVEEVPLHVEHELVPRERRACRVGIDGRGRRHRVRAAGLASHRLRASTPPSSALIASSVGRRAARASARNRRRDTPVRRALTSQSTARPSLRLAARPVTAAPGRTRRWSTGPARSGRCSPGTSTPSRRLTAVPWLLGVRVGFRAPARRGGGR